MSDSPRIEDYADQIAALIEIDQHFQSIVASMQRLSVSGRKVAARYISKHLAHACAGNVQRVAPLQPELAGGAL